MEGSDNFSEVMLDVVEVQEEAVGIEGVAGEGDGDVPVMAMERLAHAADEDGVRGGKHGLQLKGEHAGGGYGGVGGGGAETWDLGREM